MKTLYLDCSMGASGDMLTAALIGLFPVPQELLDELNALGLPGVHYSLEPSVKCGITGIHVSVTVDGAEEASGIDEHEHAHQHNPSVQHIQSHPGMADIDHIVSKHLKLPERIRAEVLQVFGLIADAESHVHGMPIPEIHFHEVGTMDAIADITAVCYLFHRLSVDEVIASPVHTGAGHVTCAHGILPVPAPATAYILQGIPAYGGSIEGELCTPTGAALLKHFVTRFGDMPVMKASAIGYGMGKLDYRMANCVRAFIGETEEMSDSVIELSCNVDDMTAEAIGYAMEKLFAGGALDVYTIPIGMKKSRPGTMIQVLCKPEDKTCIVELMFKHTSTIGIREAELGRYILNRETQTLETPYGLVRKKVSSGYGVTHMKYEYDDIARIADAQSVSLQDVTSMLENCK